MFDSIIKNYKLFFIILSSIVLSFTACKKEELDEKDLTVYQWEVVYYRLPFKKDKNGAPEYDFSQQMIEYKRDQVSLTNRQVNDIKRKVKKQRELRIDIKKL